MESPQNISLLWPSKYARESAKAALIVRERSVKDLDLTETIKALSLDKKHLQAIEHILVQLCSDLHVIRYRQDILEDLLNQPSLVERFFALFPVLQELAH